MKTKQYILTCLFGVISLCALANFNTVVYATTGSSMTTDCESDPESCDPCINNPDSPDCHQDDCHTTESCTCEQDPSYCSCDNGATNYPECNDYCTNGATNYPECTMDCHDTNSCSCQEDPNQSWCPHDCHYYGSCSCAQDPNQPKCQDKDPCKKNPNLPQCKKNKCPNGQQTLTYCPTQPGDAQSCQAIVNAENAK